MGEKRANGLRSQVAEEAARLILEHGESDYGLAKRKAARKLGIHEDRLLPSGAEIDEAIRARQGLFGQSFSEDWPDRVISVALELMRVFQQYDARLVGGLAAGVLTSSTRVELHLFSDDAKSVAIDLLNHAVRHQSIDRDVGSRGERVPGFDLEWGGVPVELSVFPLRQAHQVHIDPAGRKGVKRLSLKAAEAFLRTL